MRVRTRAEYLRKCERRLACRRPKCRSRRPVIAVIPYGRGFKRLSFMQLLAAFGGPL